MSDPASKPGTIDQFFAWQTRQNERYELFSGFPVRMMAGAPKVHDDMSISWPNCADNCERLPPVHR